MGPPARTRLYPKALAAMILNEPTLPTSLSVIHGRIKTGRIVPFLFLTSSPSIIRVQVWAKSSAPTG